MGLGQCRGMCTEPVVQPVSVEGSVDRSDVWCYNFTTRHDRELSFGRDVHQTLDSNSTKFHGETPYQSEVMD